MYQQNQIEPAWGDAYQSPCGAQSVGGLAAWIAANPWLALALAAAAGALIFGKGAK